MNERDLKILQTFAVEIRKIFPTARIWAFGSRVSGGASPDSDFDVCVVVNSLDEESDKRIMDVAWSVGFENDVVISTVTYSTRDFESGPITASPFVRSLLATGVAA